MTSKRMVCVDCLQKLFATIVQARVHGWVLWVGGAHCKACAEKRGPSEPTTVTPGPDSAVICPRCLQFASSYGCQVGGGKRLADGSVFYGPAATWTCRAPVEPPAPKEAS